MGPAFRTDVLLMLASRVGALLIGIGTSVVIARELGPEGRGAVAAAFSLTLLFMQFGTLGLVTANPYFTAQQPRSRDAIVANTLWLTIVVGLSLTAIGAGVTAVFPGVTGELGWAEVAVALTGIPFGLGAQFLQSVLLGEGRTRAYNLIELSLSLVTLVAVLVATAGLAAGPLATLAVLVGGRVVACVVFLTVVARSGQSWGADRRLARTMLRYGAKVYLATLLAFLVIRIDLLLVNGYLGTEQAGYYSTAVALADGISLLPTVVAVNLFAHVARGLDAKWSAMVFRSLAVWYGGLCLVSAVLAGPVILLLYGREFEPAVSLYLWLAPGIFCLGMLSLLAQHFAGVGFPIEAALVWVAGLALNLGINVAFLSNGAYVASVASSVAYTLLLALHVRMFARRNGGYIQLRPSPKEAWSVVLRVLRPRRAG